MKLNITIIAQMPEKMCAALYQFFHDVMKMKRRRSREKFCHFQKKIRICYFYLSTIVNLSKRSYGANRKCLPPKYSPAKILRFLFYVKFYKMSFSGQSVLAHSLMGSRH